MMRYYNKNWQNGIEKVLLSLLMLFTLFVMIVWSLDNRDFQEGVLGFPSIKFNTALSIFCICLALFIKKGTSKLGPIFFYISSSIAFILGGYTLLEYIMPSGLASLDTFFVEDLITKEYPGRMSPATAICTTLASIGLLLLRKAPKINYPIVQYLAIPIMIFAFVSIVSSLLEVHPDKRVMFFQTMSGYTSVLFLLISIILQLRERNSFLSQTLQMELAGDTILVKLLPIIILFPLLSSTLLNNTVRTNNISFDFGLAIYTVAFVFIGVLYTAIVAKRHNNTERKRLLLERELQKKVDELESFQRCLNQIAIVSSTDKRGIIDYVNDKFCEITGYDSKELIGNTHSMIKSDYHSSSFFKDLWHTIAKGDIWTSEIKNRKKDGSYYWVDTSIIPFKDKKGKIEKFLSVRLDITMQKETQAYLKKEVIKKTKKLEQAKKEKEEMVVSLKKSNQELENFAYITSHDLQEPLRQISSFSQLLERKVRAKLEDKEIKYLNFIVDGTTNMQNLIDALLNYSRVSNKTHHITEFNIEAILKRTIRQTQKMINEHNGKIEILAMPTINGKEMLIQQLFQNLITNAIKYRKQGRDPKIEIGCLDKEEYWEFYVQDNGIGIPVEYRTRVFDIFKQLHPKGRYEGNGIGLTICKKIVEQHKGNIWIAPDSLEGTRFQFTISKNIEN